MLDPSLVRSINTGRCFLLVGSGPSCELGYPSWTRLAEDVWKHVQARCPAADASTYDKFLSDCKYPELLRQAEIDLGGRDHLIALVKQLLVPDAGRTSETYSLLAKWPFPVYLTTNFDDAITHHLEQLGIHFATLRNSQTDASQVRADSSHLVFKFHGDLDHPHSAVLTSSDYTEMRTGPSRQHLRDKLTAVFSMCDVLVIGHSLADPDLQLILETAKQTAHPDRPIYMAVANLTTGEIRDLDEKYNIQVIPYKDSDHSHSQLKRFLRTADHFICARTAVPRTDPQIDESEVDAATSLLLYRQTHAAVAADAAKSVFVPLALRTLRIAHRPLTLQDLATQRPLSLMYSHSDCTTQLRSALHFLVKTGQARGDGDTEYELTPNGKDAADALAGERDTERERALGQFALDLRKEFPSLDSTQEANARQALEDVLVRTFASRGLELANLILALQNLQPGRLQDLFKAVTEAAAGLDNADLRASFVELAGRFLVEPSAPQRKYLASLSQGFFMYHLAGRDPTCSRLRREILSQTAWFLDSSVFMPLLAWGCQNYDYAVDFLRKLNDCGTANFTTGKILREAWQHLLWARHFMRDHGDDPAQLLACATGKAGYKQNLFVDGYIRMCAEGKISTFADYLKKAFPSVTLSRAAIEEACGQFGVQTLRIDAIQGFEQNDWGEIPDLQHELESRRKALGTYRGYHQVHAEAEMLVIIRQVRAGKYTLPVQDIDLRTVYFVSQSRILDLIDNGADVTTWSPEAVYRYLCTLPGSSTDPDLLQECMLDEFYKVGAQVIDRSRYLTFFGPAISQARLSFEDQKEKFLASTEKVKSGRELDEAFSRTPDLEKPFFISQMAWSITRSAERSAQRAKVSAKQAQQRADAAEDRAKKAEEDKLAAEKARRRAESEAGRLRNLNDPKHLRKRQRQDKKRRRKKRKGK